MCKLHSIRQRNGKQDMLNSEKPGYSQVREFQGLGERNELRKTPGSVRLGDLLNQFAILLRMFQQVVEYGS